LALKHFLETLFTAGHLKKIDEESAGKFFANLALNERNTLGRF